jgi:hypothetical protein
LGANVAGWQRDHCGSVGRAAGRVEFACDDTGRQGAAAVDVGGGRRARQRHCGAVPPVRGACLAGAATIAVGCLEDPVVASIGSGELRASAHGNARLAVERADGRPAAVAHPINEATVEHAHRLVARNDR